MQKIVIDTNVIVSSLIQRNYPYKIIYELFIDDKFVLCVSEELISEYYKVLSRQKFARFSDFFGRAESLLAEIEDKAKKFVPLTKIDLISDKDDNMILELADESVVGGQMFAVMFLINNGIKFENPFTKRQTLFVKFAVKREQSILLNATKFGFMMTHLSFKDLDTFKHFALYVMRLNI